jgi:hypothetical protein
VSFLGNAEAVVQHLGFDGAELPDEKAFSCPCRNNGLPTELHQLTAQVRSLRRYVCRPSERIEEAVSLANEAIQIGKRIYRFSSVGWVVGYDR